MRMTALAAFALALLAASGGTASAVGPDVTVSAADLDVTFLDGGTRLAGSRGRYLAVFEHQEDIWGVLFDAGGVSSIPPIPIAVSADDDGSPVVVAVAEGFVVVWGGQGDLEAAFVDDDAVVRNRHVIATDDHAEADYRAVRAVSTGARVLVTYSGVFFPADGAVVLDGAGARLGAVDTAADSLLSGYDVLVSDGRDFLAVGGSGCQGAPQSGCSTIRATRISSEGKVLGTTLLALPPIDSASITATFDGSRYLVAWQRGAATIEGAFLDRSGVVSSQTLQLATGTTPALLPGLEGAVLISQSESGSVARAFDPTGQPLFPSPKPISERVSAMAFDGSGYLAVSAREIATREIIRNRSELSARPFDAELETTGPEQTLRGSSREQTEPALATIGDTTMIVWSEYLPAEDRYAVFATRMNPDGGSVDGPPTRLPRSEQDQISPSIAAGGSEFLVAWRGDFVTREVATARIGLDGRLIDPTPNIVKATTAALYQDSVSTAWNGEHYLVAWGESRSVRFSLKGEVHVATLDQEGRVTGAGPRFLRDGYDARVIAVGRYFVVVSRDRYEVTADVLDGEGNVVRRALSFHNGFGVPVSPSVASSGDELLIAWRSLYGLGSALRGAVVPIASLVETRGRERPMARTVESLELGEMGGGGAARPATFVAWDGRRFLVAWYDGTDAASNTGNLDIVGAYFGSDGTPLSAAPEPLAATPQHDRDAALALTPAGVVLAYSRLAPELGIGTNPRVFFRRIDGIGARAAAGRRFDH